MCWDCCKTYAFVHLNRASSQKSQAPFSTNAEVPERHRLQSHLPAGSVKVQGLYESGTTTLVQRAVGSWQMKPILSQGFIHPALLQTAGPHSQRAGLHCWCWWHHPHPQSWPHRLCGRVARVPGNGGKPQQGSCSPVAERCC